MENENEEPEIILENELAGVAPLVDQDQDQELDQDLDQDSEQVADQDCLEGEEICEPEQTEIPDEYYDEYYSED